MSRKNQVTLAERVVRAQLLRRDPGAGEAVRTFVSPPLPLSPAIDVLALLDRFSAAEPPLGRLDGITLLLPRQELFPYIYVRKDAVLSLQFEGTQSTLTDLLRFETETQSGQPIDDIHEVSNYVDAMMYGPEWLEKLAPSLRLIFRALRPLPP
jgi:Fic family protein